MAVSDDGKTLTFTAAKQPDNCAAPGTWFWMKVPASPKPDADGGGTTLDGRLGLAPGGAPPDMPLLDGTDGTAVTALAVTDNPAEATTAAGTATGH